MYYIQFTNYYTDLTDCKSQIIVCIVSKISEKQVLESVESLESKIKFLIEEKDRLLLQYQSLKEDNESLEAEIHNIKTQKERAKSKVEDVLERLNQIETSA